MKWYRKAAEQGHAAAQYNLGFLYELQDFREAVKWHQKAAEQGHAAAQFRLGRHYHYGNGVQKNGKKAFLWYCIAAENGDAHTQCYLGLLFSRPRSSWADNPTTKIIGADILIDGVEVPTDLKKAFNWYHKAALQGNASAYVRVAEMYANGDGVLENDVLAYAWYNICIASAKVPREAHWEKIEKARVAEVMTPEQIAEAQALSRTLLNRIKGVQEANRRRGLPKARVSAPENRQPTSFGTGFFITDDGYLMTNLHVVNKANSILVKTRFGNLPAKVIKVDANNDLAVLKVAGRFNALPIASSRGVRLGADVFTVGYPRIDVQGLSPKLTKGAINSLAGVRDDPRHFQVSVPIQPGNSGGPLVDENGNVVGVIVSTLNAGLILKREGRLPQSVNYAVKGSFANSFLESIPNLAKRLKAPNAAGRAGKFTDLVGRVEAATVLIVALGNEKTSDAEPTKLKRIAINTPKKTVYLNADEWVPMKNEFRWALNYQANRRSQNQKFNTVLTVFLNPMTKDKKKQTKQISENEYLEIFPAPPFLGNCIVVKLFVDKGDYWISTRDTFQIKTCKVGNVSTDQLVYRLVKLELKGELENRRFFIRNSL